MVSRLGRGGMGTVYKAVDETLDREVAIKCLNPHLGDPEVLRRFRTEAMTLARMNHPSIATLFELAEHDGELLMVMEFVRGETLETLSHRLGPLPVDRAATLCGQILDALGHAHGAGIVHRDLKPANLMLADSGLTKVMDFGLARMAGTAHLTNDGFMVGTPAYMAPEQVEGGGIDGRADLYAIGVVLYRLLTSQLPFEAESGIAMARKQIHGEPTPVRQFRTELPAAWDEIFGRALAKAPQDRYQTAEDFRAALAELGGVGPASSWAQPAPSQISALRSSRPQLAAPTVKLPAPRRPNAAATAVLGALLFAGIPLTTLLVWRSLAARPSAASPLSTPVDFARPAAPPASVPKPAATTPKAKAAPTPSFEPAPVPETTVGPGIVGTAAPLPAVTFGKLSVLVVDGGKSRERAASLSLGADGLQVVDDQKTIQTVQYREITGLFHSHSREPRWTAPDGTAMSIAKSGSRFGFLKGAPDWITLRTRNAFLALRVQDTDTQRVIAALEARTGTRIVRTR